MTAVMAFSAAPRGPGNSGKWLTLPKLRDLHIDRPGARIPGSGPVPVAAVHPVVAALVRAGTAELNDIRAP